MNNMAVFLKNHRAKLSEPIVQVFLNQNKNREIFNNYIENPSKENKRKLDKAFKVHYQNARIKSYISKLIHFYAIDFDKRISLRSKRQLLIDHNSNREDTNIKSYNDLISSKADLTFNYFNQKQPRLRDHLTNKRLFEGLKKLTKKQEKILDLAYVYNLSNKEISKVLNESPQTISYNHKVALQKLKEFL
ncbi:RNA polymerase sigma factor (sigma-70 family) [Sporosarcina luteola]|nr:RNA polymerase sigma factor (sigma-70 family) [Sporosarcina luteola]